MPSGYEHQSRLLEDAEERLRFGDRQLTWRDVWQKDYFVRLRKSGVHEVKRFRPCFYCEQMAVRRQ